MFIREKKTKTTTVLQLVENRRRGNGKVRQEIIVSLGGAAIPDQYRREVAVEVKNRLMGYQRLVPLEYEIGRWGDHILKKLILRGNFPLSPAKKSSGTAELVWMACSLMKSIMKEKRNLDPRWRWTPHGGRFNWIFF